MKKKRKFVPLGMGLVALMIGIAMAQSADKLMEAAEQGGPRVERAKKELLASAGLFKLHHKVYSKVGARDWQNRVKPEFMRAITLRTVQATGDPLPSLEGILQWVRSHPEEARDLLQQLSE